jgi:hypothetical protein
MRTLTLSLLSLLLATAAHADRIDKTFPVRPGQELLVDAPTGASLTVHGTSDGVARITIDRSGTDAASIEVTVEATAKGIEVHTIPPANRRNFSSNVHIEARVPQSFNVVVHSAGGTVELEDLKGTFKGSTLGGEIRLRNLEGEAHLETNGGSIEVTQSTLSGKVSTLGGDVDLIDVLGSLQGTTLGGKVNRRGKSDAHSAGNGTEPVSMSSMGGDLTVEDAPNGADVHTMGGNIHIHSVAKYVKARTMGGDIQIDNASGEVKATTMGGNVQVTISGASAERSISLQSMSGELTLAIPANLPVSFEVNLDYTRNSSRNYHIQSDFALKIEESSNWESPNGNTPRKRIHGTGQQGAGTVHVLLETINGNVHIIRVP